MTTRLRRLIATLSVAVAALGLTAVSASSVLAATPEEPVTEAAQEITATTATLQGEVNPNVEATTGFEFTYNSNGTCAEGFTTEAGTEAKVTASKVSTHVTGLEPNREYTFCIVATSFEEGTTESTSGQPVTFKTLTAKPAIDAESVSGVTPFEATLEAQVSPYDQVTTYSVEYSTSATGEKLEGPITTIKGAGPLLGYGEQSASVSTGAVLEPATTYHYRVVATSLSGTTEGKVQVLTTRSLDKPLIESESASAITRSGASLSALIDPEFQEAMCRAFQYVDGAAFAASEYAGAAEAPCEPIELGAGSEATVADAMLAGLAANTTYHFRVLAENASGVSDGPDETFLTAPDPPEALSGEASSVTTNGATISGSVNPGSVGPNSDARYFFQYGRTTSYGAQAPLAPGDAGVGTSPVIEEANLNALEPGSTYHYRIVASNDDENTPQFSYGEDRTFTTVATPPILSGVSLSAVTQSSVTITATLDPQGLPARYELLLGSSAGLLQAQACGNAAGGVIPIALSVASLNPASRYYYRLIATSLDGSSESEGTFTTVAGAGAESALIQPPTPPLLATPAIVFPVESTPPPTKKGKLTRAERLALALEACKKKPKSKRAACQKRARHKYGAAKRSR